MVPVSGVCRRSEIAWNIAVEINHIVVPARDKRATAGLLAYILGMEVEGNATEIVRIRAGNGLTIDFCEPYYSWAFQCAFLVGDTEFDAALARIKSGTIEFYARCDRTGRGRINLLHGARSIYFDDPSGHLFELIEQPDMSAIEGRIKAVAIKLTL